MLSITNSLILMVMGAFASIGGGNDGFSKAYEEPLILVIGRQFADKV